VVLFVISGGISCTNNSVMNMVGCCVRCQLSEKERTLLWRWLLMDSVLTPLSIECSVVLRSFSDNRH
jgi:hypothetical protein